MRNVTRVALFSAAIAVQLVATGCVGIGGGSGSGSLFDDDSDGFQSFASNDGFGGSDSGSEGSGDGFGDDFHGVATTSNPEPASLALFGGGLAGVGLWRRRKASKRST